MEEKDNLPVGVEEKQEEPIGLALTSFILGFFGDIFSLTGILSLPALVMGIVGLALSNRCQDVTKRPFSSFKKIGHAASIAAIAVGAVMTTLVTIGLTILAIWLAFKNGNAKAS